MAFCTLASQCQWVHIEMSKNLDDESFHQGALPHVELPRNSEKMVLIHLKVTSTHTYYPILEMTTHINTISRRTVLTAQDKGKSKTLPKIYQWL